jgi:hypothetical protein
MALKTDLLRGTLDLLILQTLALGPNHGLGVARRIQQVTRGTFEIGPGSLFPALHRLEEKGGRPAAASRRDRDLGPHHPGNRPGAEGQILNLSPQGAGREAFKI